VPGGCFALFGSSIGYHTGRALSEGVTHRLFRYVFCFLRHARRARALMRVGARSGFDLGRPRSALAKPCGKKPSLHRSSAGTCSCSCSCWLPRSARAKIDRYFESRLPGNSDYVISRRSGPKTSPLELGVVSVALLRCTLKCSVAHYMFTRSPGDIFRETRLLRRSGEPGKIDTKLYVQPRNLSKRHPALCQGRVFRHTTLRCMSAMERMLVV
jgi:hypothetical protein